MVHRAWNAIQNPLTLRGTGQDVRAVFGFMQTFLSVIQRWSPTHVAITFDTPKPTFRHLESKEYKAHRPETPQELRSQFPIVREVMEAFRIPIFAVDGFEADDLLGTLSTQATEKGIVTLILTGDTDALQLVSPTIKVLLYHRPGEQKVCDEEQVAVRYEGLTPAQVIDFKALVGDASDNIRGVPGVGKKTAIKLLLEYGTISGIYANLETLPTKQRALFEEYRDLLAQGVRLVTIRHDVPVELDIEKSRFGLYDRSDVEKVCRKLEFFSMIHRIPGSHRADSGYSARSARVNAVERYYETVETKEDLRALVNELTRATTFSLDTETTSIDPMNAELVGLSFATLPGRAWYIPVGHASGRQLPIGDVLGSLRLVLEDANLGKVAHNANFDWTVLANNGINVKGLAFDTMLAAHMLGRKSLGLKELALEVLGEPMAPITSIIGLGRNQTTFDAVPIELAAAYAAADADMTLRLRLPLQRDLESMGSWKLLEEVELPLLPVIVGMQRTGIAVDIKLLEKMGVTLGREIERLEAEGHISVGHRFNLNSPAQLGKVLFEELRITGQYPELGRPKRTRTGGYSTDAATLEMLRGVHPVVDLVLEYRQLSKLKSTYVDALPQAVNSHTRRIHTTYKQAGSVTGRISSHDPNLQNIPIRTDLGRQIRQAFLPGVPDWILVAADYSQIELRVLAHLSHDRALLEAFSQDQDIHAATAAQVFGIGLNSIDAEQRRVAKAINFGVIYGLSAFGLTQHTRLTYEESQRFIDTYFLRYPGISDYVERTKEQARRKGYVETMLGRRRFMSEIHSPNRSLRQAAEREAINMPVQGTAAEIMKLAMLSVAHSLETRNFRSRMLLQVHDELILEAPMEEVQALKRLLLDVMPGATELAVPLRVTVKTGKNWGELE